MSQCPNTRIVKGKKVPEKNKKHIKNTHKSTEYSSVVSSAVSIISWSKSVLAPNILRTPIDSKRLSFCFYFINFCFELSLDLCRSYKNGERAHVVLTVYVTMATWSHAGRWHWYLASRSASVSPPGPGVFFPWSQTLPDVGLSCCESFVASISGSSSFLQSDIILMATPIESTLFSLQECHGSDTVFSLD
jgi:hypothetical protein